MDKQKLYNRLSEQAKQVFNKIKEEYYSDSICMSELIASINIMNMSGVDTLSLEDCFYIYMLLMNWSEGDVFFRKIQNSGELEELN